MSKYYYLVAQLPFLRFAEESYMSKEHFLIEAKKWLKDEDFLMLAKAKINFYQPQSRDSKVLRDYKNFEQSLAQKIADFRISKGAAFSSFGAQKTSENNFGNGIDLNLNEGTPLDIEVRLLKVRWKFIENLEGGHVFDLEALILYFLKLQILERLFIFNKEKGTIAFDSLCAIAL